MDSLKSEPPGASYDSKYGYNFFLLQKSIELIS